MTFVSLFIKKELKQIMVEKLCLELRLATSTTTTTTTTTTLAYYSLRLVFTH